MIYTNVNLQYVYYFKKLKQSLMNGELVNAKLSYYISFVTVLNVTFFYTQRSTVLRTLKIG